MRPHGRTLLLPSLTHLARLLLGLHLLSIPAWPAAPPPVPAPLVESTQIPVRTQQVPPLPPPPNVHVHRLKPRYQGHLLRQVHGLAIEYSPVKEQYVEPVAKAIRSWRTRNGITLK